MRNSDHNTQYPPPKQAWAMLIVLSLTYMFSFMDRQILVLLIDPIKTDLQISDTQVSLLTGLAFALVYSFAGIPMGRLADLWVRKYVIIFGVSVWSSLTILSGCARNFPQLFIARMGVGLGEAALTPTAYAMVPDLFPPHKLARAMSVFVLGGVIGGSMALIFGGVIVGLVEHMEAISLPLIGKIRSWQVVLFAAGGLSLLMLIPLSLLPEPKRHLSRAFIAKSSIITNNNIHIKQNPAFKKVLDYLWEHRDFYGFFLVGITIYNLFGYGLATWLPSYFIRVHEWDASTTGITLGVIYVVPSIIGALSSGWLADYFYGKGYKTAPLLIIVICLLFLAPLLLIFIYIPQMEAKITTVLVYTLIEIMLAALFPTVIQMATPNRIRAQVSAIHLMVSNLVGIGFGATTIALVTDYVFQDDLAVGHSIAIVGVAACVISICILFFALNPFKQRVLAVMSDYSQTLKESEKKSSNNDPVQLPLETTSVY